MGPLIKFIYGIVRNISWGTSAMTFWHRLTSVAVLGALTVGTALATPTSILWNPSVDIQAPKTAHLGLDHYSTTDGEGLISNDLGLTWGAGSGFEIGVDYITPLSENFQFNAKWGLPERDNSPAFAVGAQFFGDEDSAPNILYALVAKTFGTSGRFTLGAYTGNDDVLGNDESGIIAAWDKTFNAKWWGAIDYSSGNNAYGQISVGGAYKFAPNSSFMLAYLHFPELTGGAKNQITAQVDFDF